MRDRLLAGILLVSLLGPHPLAGQVATSGSHEVDGASLHYLDFGGEGLPIVFIHAADRGAQTWIDFAPSFTDRHRVVALTARGIGESTGEPSPTDVRAADLISLLDALGIPRAVFIGNSSPAQDMTYMAEHYEDRVAGLVYLANAPFLDEIIESETTGAFAYALDATQPPNPFPYRPAYLDADAGAISVPALTFVGESGTRGMEQMVYPLRVAELVRTQGSEWITDPHARAFLERLAEDEALQAEVIQDWEQRVAPAIVRNEEQFRRAFGQQLQIVGLPVPLVTGYEYRDRPDLIRQHILDFLAGISQGNGT